MSTGNINYPPKNIYDPSSEKSPDYDHLILWMLSNNKSCTWADFNEEPIKIPGGTLSRHLKKLMALDYIEKISRGLYKITSEGKRKFHELSSAKRKIRRLNYPPRIILRRGRNYDHWILWMVYNNRYCKRSDFFERPLSINQSSLSKSLKALIVKGFIIKQDTKYLITQLGKIEYSKMLENYDLDRQTLLEEESKRIREMTGKTLAFFKKYRIKDEQVQIRFLIMLLEFSYDKVKPLLKNEENFHKVLLFFAMNSPSRYPEHISREEFSQLYKITQTTLDYYLTEICEGKIYPTRFFKLKDPSENIYYLQMGEKLEKMLRIITQEHIANFSYLNQLHSEKVDHSVIHNIDNIIKSILDESCETLFHEDFKETLKELLPSYLKYLTYKIESKKEIRDSYDKIEQIIWQNIAEVLDQEARHELRDQYEDRIEEIDIKIESDPLNYDLYNLKLSVLVYFNQYNSVLNLLEEMLNLFPDKEINLKMKKASILKRLKDPEGGLKVIEDLIIKFPENQELQNYKAHWLKYLDKKDEAITIVKDLIDIEPENGFYYDSYGEILMYFQEYQEAIKKFGKALSLNPNDWYIYQTYCKLGICYKALGKEDLALRDLTKAKEIIKTIDLAPDIKQRWLAILDLFLSE